MLISCFIIYSSRPTLKELLGCFQCFVFTRSEITVETSYFLFWEQIPGSRDTKSKNKGKCHFDKNYTSTPPLTLKSQKSGRKKKGQ